jgi:hypothetical protein
MTPIEDTLTAIAGEPIRLRTHPSPHVHRYVPVADPANSPNADLWRARGAGGWYPTADEAAVALAFDLGLRQGRAEGAPPPKFSGKIETRVLAVVQALAAAGGKVTESAVIGATALSMTIPTGQRDRRREFARRAFIGLVKRGALVITDDGAVTACRMRQVA